MLLAGVFFGGLAVSIRAASAEVHPFEIVFFRNFVGFVFLLPWFWRRGFHRLRTRHMGLHGSRAAVGLGSMFLWFTAMSLMPLAEATALGFTAPLFAAVGAALFLGEVVRLRRWTAILVGFAGTLIVLRPGAGVISGPAMLVLGGAVLVATSALLTKVLVRTDEPDTIVFYLNALTTPFSFVFALFVWKWPATTGLIWLIAVGVTAALGHLAYTRAYAAADMSAVIPYDFSRLVFTAIFAFALFGQVPDIWTWIGGGVIFLSVVYIARRESMAAKREASAAPAPPPITGDMS